MTDRITDLRAARYLQQRLLEDAGYGEDRVADYRTAENLRRRLLAPIPEDDRIAPEQPSPRFGWAKDSLTLKLGVAVAAVVAFVLILQN